MRAAVLRNIGDDKLEVRDDLTLTPVGPGEVKVKIHATGVCHSDVSGMNGTIPQPSPFVPGHEGAGVVAEVGEGVTSSSPGTRRVGRARSASNAGSPTCASTF
jgi:S-(hydroxymethyl)glutathione dehydrogenase / alcohol dehydrogenase